MDKQKRSRSRSRGGRREASKSRSGSRGREDKLVPAAAAPQRVRIQSFEEILAAVRSGAMPSMMPARAGSALQPQTAGGFMLPARSLYDSGYKGQMFGPSGEDCPQARPEMLERAKEEAKMAEEQGKRAAKKGASIPTGPPGLPTGVVVVEQKYVDFLLGPGGQSLAAINHAAGVNVNLDQTHKFSGYSIANIYGPEDRVRNAKLAIDFKLSQWLPLHERRRTGGAVNSQSNQVPAPLGGREPSATWRSGSQGTHAAGAAGASPATWSKDGDQAEGKPITGGLL